LVAQPPLVDDLRTSWATEGGAVHRFVDKHFFSYPGSERENYIDTEFTAEADGTFHLLFKNFSTDPDGITVWKLETEDGHYYRFEMWSDGAVVVTFKGLDVNLIPYEVSLTSPPGFFQVGVEEVQQLVFVINKHANGRTIVEGETRPNPYKGVTGEVHLNGGDAFPEGDTWTFSSSLRPLHQEGIVDVFAMQCQISTIVGIQYLAWFGGVPARRDIEEMYQGFKRNQIGYSPFGLPSDL